MDDLVKRLRAVDHGSIEDCFTQSPLFERAAAAIEARDAMLREVMTAATDAAAHLVAATSLLARGGKKAAASDKMFRQMLADYNASIARTRTTLAKAEEMLK